MKRSEADIRRSLRGGAVAVVLSVAAGPLTTVPAAADEAHARDLFKAMSDYLVAQKAISFTFDATLEIVTTDLQKIGFASSGAITLNRPDKIRMTRTGGFADVELAYDGTGLAVMGKNMDIYATLPVSGTIDELIDTLRFDHGFSAPAADLLSADPFEAMMSDVTDVKDLGSGVIGGQECDHLAFRTSSTDWQIWIAQGDTPYPCRFTITSKLMAQAPSYTIEVAEWKTGVQVADDDFRLKTGDAKEVPISEVSSLDDVPGDLAEGDAQ